jgi:hypothetical protein
MCQRVRCQRCGKPTWAGCGRHVEQALAGVAAEERCGCQRSFLAKLLGLGATRGTAPQQERQRQPPKAGER